MATSAKKGKPVKDARRAKKIDLAQYAQLRTMLDSLELGALRYYLSGATAAEKARRFEALYSQLMPTIRKLWGGSKGLDFQCPEGYTNCNGCCVPYDCFSDSL